MLRSSAPTPIPAALVQTSRNPLRFNIPYKLRCAGCNRNFANTLIHSAAAAAVAAVLPTCFRAECARAPPCLHANKHAHYLCIVERIHSAD